jgi:hypothetical protein
MTAGLQQMAFTQTRLSPQKNLLFAGSGNALLQVRDNFMMSAGKKITKCLIGPEFKM